MNAVRARGVFLAGSERHDIHRVWRDQRRCRLDCDRKWPKQCHGGGYQFLLFRMAGITAYRRRTSRYRRRYGSHRVATIADVAGALRLPVVLVVGLRLGCLNHALLSAQAIARAGATLAGRIGSAIDPAMPAQIENIEALKQRLPAPQLGLLAFSRAAEHDAAALELAAHALMGPPARGALWPVASCRPVRLP